MAAERRLPDFHLNGRRGLAQRRQYFSTDGGVQSIGAAGCVPLDGWKQGPCREILLAAVGSRPDVRGQRARNQGPDWHVQVPRDPAVAGTLRATLQPAHREHCASGPVRRHNVADVLDEDLIVLSAVKRTALPGGWLAGTTDASAQGA